MKQPWSTARFVLAVLSIALILFPMAGCGGDTAYVSGSLRRHDGSPLDGARVTARATATGEAASALTDAQGHFELTTEKNSDGIPPGDYYVIIYEDRGDPDYPNPWTISTKYTKRSASGIEFSVAAGERKVLDLTLDPP